MVALEAIMRSIQYVVLAAAVVMLGSAGAAQEPAPTPNDYSKPETWLCRPGVSGPCTSDQSATEIAADGSTKAVAFERPTSPAFDCFYVYPTASEDPTPFSDMTAGREIQVTTAQFGRYGAVCRQFAPIYRSGTLAALRARSAGTPVAAAYPNTNYDDVVQAWKHYLAHDNNSRGVLLVGHSQGASLITRLVANEIEGKPVAKQIIAIHQLGTTIQVPAGKDVGGSYKTFPLCKRADQAGCVIVYGTYRSTLPPSVNPPARFGARPRGVRRVLHESGGARRRQSDARHLSDSRNRRVGAWQGHHHAVRTIARAHHRRVRDARRVHVSRGNSQRERRGAAPQCRDRRRRQSARSDVGSAQRRHVCADGKPGGLSPHPEPGMARGAPSLTNGLRASGPRLQGLWAPGPRLLV